MKFIKKAIPAKMNRVRVDFADGIHSIESINANDSTVSMSIRSYASIEAYNFVDDSQPSPEPLKPNRNDGRVINEIHKSCKMSDLKFDFGIENPYEQLKAAAYDYLVSDCKEYIGGEIVDYEV